MLLGLSAEEFKRLLLSIGTHRGERPLSPVEAAGLLRKAQDAGASASDCAKAVHLEGPTWIARFIKILDLPEDVYHLIDWGRRNGSIAFTSATEIARLTEDADQRTAIKAALEHDLSSSEVRQLVQLRLRSHKPMDACVSAVLKMRPQVQLRHVFIGAITSDSLRRRLQSLSQHERDANLSALFHKEWPLTNVSGHLGTQHFTLVGDKEFGDLVKNEKETIERKVNGGLEECLTR